MELFGMKWKTNGIYFELFLAQSTKCRTPSAIVFSLFTSALPNELSEEKRRVCGLRLPKRMQSKEIVRWVKRIEQFMSEAWSAEGGGRVVFDWLFLILGGLRAGPPAIAPHKRESKQINQTQLVFYFSFLHLIEQRENQIERKEEERAERAKQQTKGREKPRWNSFFWLVMAAGPLAAHQFH